MILRRASELNSRRGTRGSQDTPSVSPEVLVQVAAAAGIPEQDVRRAMWDMASEKTAEPRSFARKFYGPARLRAVRDVERSAESTREYLEGLLRSNRASSSGARRRSGLWDPGDELGVVRRTLDFRGTEPCSRPVLVELRVEGLGEERCEANLTADLSNQRGEYLSLAGILGATLAALFILAGMQSPLFFLGVLPVLAAPALGFRFAYSRASLELRRALDHLLDAAEESQPQEEPQTAATVPAARYKASSPFQGSPPTGASG